MTLIGMKRTNVDFTVLVFEGAFPSGVAATRDILSTAAMLADRVGVAKPTWRFCSLTGGRTPLQGGMFMDTQKLSSAVATDQSTWIILGLAANTPERVSERVQAKDIQSMTKRIRQHVQKGGEVAASCSAVFVLHEAGLLANRRATTTWWLAPHLRQLSPTCRVDEGRMICVDGKVTTCGAAFAHIDLMIHLLKEKFGKALAELVSSFLLIERKPAQSRFIIPAMMATGDEFLGNVTQRIEASLPKGKTVNQLANELGMSSRTLSRRIQEQTGKSTLALIQQVRLRRARLLLETSRLSIDRVSESVGYRDSAALRRLMKRELGISPKNLR